MLRTGSASGEFLPQALLPVSKLAVLTGCELKPVAVADRAGM